MRRLLCVICMMLLGSFVYAATDVEVVIPEFKVVLNETEVDSIKAQYPMIEYKGITYIPMTWDMCQSLGLEVTYSSTEGLKIKQGNTKGLIIVDQKGLNSRDSKYQAKLIDYDVELNGVKIDNASETYPILNFRSITYFPLTWRFAHDEFGWTYTYSDENGLVIDSNEIEDQTLPQETSENDSDDESVEDSDESEAVVITSDVSDDYKEQYPEEFFTYSTYDGLEIAEAIKGKFFYRGVKHTIDHNQYYRVFKDEFMTYAYHPSFATRNVLEHDDAVRFGTDENILKLEEHANRIRKITGNFNVNRFIFKNNIVYIYGSRSMYGTKGTFASMSFLDFSEGREDDDKEDSTDLLMYYPEDDEVDITIMGDFYENLQAALEITVTNVYDEERRERIASFIIHTIKERYQNEDNPFSIENEIDKFNTEKYNTEFYVDGYYIAFEQDTYRNRYNGGPIINIILR